MLNRIFALILLIISLPITLFVWLILTVTTKNQAFFKQERIGFKKIPFTIFKFTTMENGEVTTVGKYLRKTGLDEFPQLINILKGEMAFVGPRPLTQFDITRLKWNTEDKSARWNVIPGISGLAQLSRICTAADSIKNDLYYVRNKSLALDLKIFFRSMVIPLIGKPKLLINE